jgi:DNA modification methylase
MRIRDLKIKASPAAILKSNRRNPRKHSPKQLRQIADSIVTFGWTNPIIIDENNNVLAGHGRLAAAKMLGLDHVPTICINDMTEAQKRAYALADNKLAENAAWDDDLLALELTALIKMDPEFDLTATGFEMGEIDLRVGNDTDDEGADEADNVPELEDGSPAVTRPGDLWQVGEHRILCSDARQPSSFETLMGSELADMVFTDPPYNVPVHGHASGLGSVTHREFAEASGEMTDAEYEAFLVQTLTLLAAFSRSGAIHFVCSGWHHFLQLLKAGAIAYDELKNICVWVKTNGGMGSLYRSQHELITVYKKGSRSHVNNVELGRLGRNRSNVWTYAGTNSFGSKRDEALQMHPTVKPIRLVQDAILDCSNRGDIVLDAFLGSGTTIVAAPASSAISQHNRPYFYARVKRRLRAIPANSCR